MAAIYISIGSNIEREKYIKNALEQLEATFGALSVSSVFESEAVGFEGDDFYNLVVGADTDKPLTDVVQILKQIEEDNGRIRSAKKFSARTLDLDILTYDDLVVEEPAQIPRDEITKNAFVLWPLAEIAPDVLHPTEKQSYADLWQQYDKSKQKLWTVPFEWKTEYS